jgi:AbrB family looped-hinge helix DNA binding protein
MADAAITSKRQVTLPAEICEELGLKPGDRLRIERRRVGRDSVWVISGKKPDWSWFGRARLYARKKSHAWSEIERSIERGWREHRD